MTNISCFYLGGSRCPMARAGKGKFYTTSFYSFYSFTFQIKCNAHMSGYIILCTPLYVSARAFFFADNHHCPIKSSTNNAL